MHSAIVANIGTLHGLSHRALASVLQRVSLGTGCTRLVARRPGAQASVEQLTSFPLLGEPKPRVLVRCTQANEPREKKTLS